MNRILLALAGAVVLAGAASAQTQDNTISSGPFRFGLSAGPTNNSPFGNGAARYEKENPANRLPWDGQANANASGAGPQLGPEGGGSPMSRGGINDTLTGSNPRATITAPAAKPRKQADKSTTQGEKLKP